MKSGTQTNSNADKLFYIGGICLSILLLILIGIDAWKSIPHPLAHDYGEGVTAWMAREFANGLWPYGDITEIPSRYVCYGPLPAWIAALFSPYMGEDGGMKFVLSGRVLNLIYWLVAGAFIGLLCRPKWAPLALAPALFLAVSQTTFTWTFRVDSMMLMFESIILYLLARQSGWILKAGLPLCVTSLILVKPTAALDLLPIGIMAGALRHETWREYIGLVFKPTLVSIILAPAVFFFIDWISGGWMANNILTVQRNSGWTIAGWSWDSLGPIALFILSPTLLPLLFWGIVGPATHENTKARLTLIALALGYCISVGLNLKLGAVSNYFFPLLVLLGGAASFKLQNTKELAIFVVAMAASSLPLSPVITDWDSERPRQAATFMRFANMRSAAVIPANSFMSDPTLAASTIRGHMPAQGVVFDPKQPTNATSLHIPEYLPNVQELSDNVVQVHKQPNLITEDVFYSVLADQQPLISDIFQFNVMSSVEQNIRQKALDAATALWGKEHIAKFLGATTAASPWPRHLQSQIPIKNPKADIFYLPAPPYFESELFPADQVSIIRPRYTPYFGAYGQIDPEFPFQLFLRVAILPSLLVLLLVLFWPPTSTKKLS